MANIFNAAQYLALYPAIADYGYNEANAWDHFVQYGAAELRTPNDELKGKVYAESVLNYANGNPELAEYFGVVVPAESLTAAQQGELLLHYVMYGNAEDRANKIIDAPVQSEDADLSDLRDALEAIVAADAGVKEAIKSAEKALKVEGADAVAEKYEDAAEVIEFGLVDDVVNPALVITGFANVQDAAVRTQLIEAKQAQLAVVEQQTGKALGADKAKVDAYLATVARLENLTERESKAVENAQNVATLAGANLTVAQGKGYQIDYVEADNTYTITVEGETPVTLSVDENNRPVFAPADSDVAKVVKASDSYSSLAQSLQSVNSLQQQVEKAGIAVQDAMDKIDLLDNDVDAYITAKNNVKEYADNVAELRKTEAYQNAIDEANAAHKAAEEALEELGYEINTDNFGTAGDDLFVYGNDDATVFAFGAEGEDLFFFGDFAFVELKANDDFAKGNFGDRNTLEIFAQQQGTDVVLYVEINEVGGNAFGIDDNVNTITLVGVNLEDLSFDSGAGFLVG